MRPLCCNSLLALTLSYLLIFFQLIVILVLEIAFVPARRACELTTARSSCLSQLPGSFSVFIIFARSNASFLFVFASVKTVSHALDISPGRRLSDSVGGRCYEAIIFIFVIALVLVIEC